MEDYNKKGNNELIQVLNNLSDEHEKLKQDVENTLMLIDNLEKEYLYIQEIIKKRMG